MVAAADGGGDERPLPAQAAPVVEPAAAVGDARQEDAVDPPLHDRGDGEPEHREAQDQQIRRQQLRYLLADVRRERPVLVAVPLLERVDRVVGPARVPEVPARGPRVEPHRVEVGHHDLVPLRRQLRHGPVLERAGEGLRFVVRVDDQRPHRRVPLTPLSG